MFAKLHKNIIKMFRLFVLLLLLSQPLCARRTGRMALFQHDGTKHVLHTDECTGIYFDSTESATEYKMGRLVGLWAFYDKYCGEAVNLIAGIKYCFPFDPQRPTIQMHMIGNARNAFEPAISRFQRHNFAQLTFTISDDEYFVANSLRETSTTGSWITVTNVKWTLYGDSGQSLCLAATAKGYRIFCTYNEGLIAEFDKRGWSSITYIRKGCYSKDVYKAESCFPIVRASDPRDCETPPDKLDEMVPCGKNGETEDNPLCDLTKEDLKNTTDPDMIEIDRYFEEPEEENEKKPVDFPALFRRSKKKKPKTKNFRGPLLEVTTELSSSEEDLRPTPTEKPISIKNCFEMTRNDVRLYWADPASNQCEKSVTNALFTDQLRRFAASRLTKLFDSKVRSLEQVGQLINQTKEIFKKTCSEDYVPGEFVDMAVEAFLMFINEDFFYGVEELDQNTFESISKGLKSCKERAEPFVYKADKMGCGLKKISGSLILPSEVAKVEIPESAKGKHFEPLIETIWKVFLNAHSYCPVDFQYPNDHHKFSILFLQLFSKNIYEKWIEPLETQELYKFIVPKFEALKEIMENIDYCVGATEKVFKRPVWMTRSNPAAKSILDLDDKIEMSNDLEEVKPQISRKKRSSWDQGLNKERVVVSLWHEDALCTNNMVDPARLGLTSCEDGGYI